MQYALVWVLLRCLQQEIIKEPYPNLHSANNAHTIPPNSLIDSNAMSTRSLEDSYPDEEFFSNHEHVGVI